MRVKEENTILYFNFLTNFILCLQQFLVNGNIYLCPFLRNLNKYHSMQLLHLPRKGAKQINKICTGFAFMLIPHEKFKLFEK